MSDTYTVAEAAKVLQRSPKRVRQMLREGKLAALPNTDPQRIAAEQVHALREALRTQGPRTGPKPQQPAGLTYEQVRELVEELTRPAMRALEATQQNAERVEATLREELAAERAERLRLQAEAERLQQELEAKTQPRKWWKKS